MSLFRRGGVACCRSARRDKSGYVAREALPADLRAFPLSLLAVSDEATPSCGRDDRALTPVRTAACRARKVRQ